VFVHRGGKRSQFGLSSKRRNPLVLVYESQARGSWHIVRGAKLPQNLNFNKLANHRLVTKKQGYSMREHNG